MFKVYKKFKRLEDYCKGNSSSEKKRVGIAYIN